MSTTAIDVHSPAEGHGHGHDDPTLKHHFHTKEQQFDASKLGMWLFLATEILLFGGLFVGFGLMQGKYPEAFVQAHHHLDRVLGSINTVVLLCSSFTMVLAVNGAQRSKRTQTQINLVLTLIFAGIFLVIKFFEYRHKFEEGLLPGKFFTYPHGLHEQFVFFSFYFMMTGLHGIHVILGMLGISWVLVRSTRGEFDAKYYTPVDLVGLYWHLVDLIWIYLFPLMYLIS